MRSARVSARAGAGPAGGRSPKEESRFLYGDFINQVLTFVIIAAAVFFLVVKPVNALMARLKSGRPVDEEVRDCPECLSEIPAKARRCAFCTAEVAPSAL